MRPEFNNSSNAQVPLDSSELRELLRRLRDLDLHAPHVAIRDQRRVSIAGCVYPDSPASNSLRYLLRGDDGTEFTLRIASEGNGLDLQLIGKGQTSPLAQRQVQLQLDADGRLLCPELGARVAVGSAGEKELDHFLRRLVRGLCSELRSVG